MTERRVRAAALYVAVIGICAFGMAAAFRDRTSDLVDEYGRSHPPTVAVQVQP